MRVTLTLLACVVAHGSVDSRKKSRFGPDDCVTLSRSAESGSCIITTDCNDEVDTTAFQDFEVSFLCSSNDESVPSVRHAFPGSEWAATEVYDTGVTCDICEPAPEVTTATTVAPAASNTTAAATTAAAAVQHIPPPSAAFYGPSGCVATYRSKEGTCIMQTRCGSQDISTYEFGLTCVDGQGETERHLFGTESFDTEETFDTLIECKLCLGLDGEQLSAQNDTSLAADVATLQSEMKELQVAVEEIKNHIPGLGAGNGTAPAAEAAPAEDAAPVAAEGDEAEAAEEEPAAEEGETEEAGEAEEGEAEEEPAPAASLLRGQKKHAKKAVVRKHTSHAHVKKAVARKHVSHGKKHVAKKHVAKKKKHAALKHEDDLDLGIDDASLDEALSEFDAN